MKKFGLASRIMIGLVLGVIVGLVIPESIATLWIRPFGDVFIKLIRMIIIPLVFASLVVGASSVGDIKMLGRIGGKTLGYYLITTAFAIIIGLIVALIVEPGHGIQLAVDATYKGKEAPSIVETLLNIVPENPQQSIVNGNMLQIIVFALFIGIGITLAQQKAEPIKNLFDGLSEIMFKITDLIMQYAPIGVFALMVPVTASQGLQVIMPLIKIIFVVYVACFIHGIVVYSFAVKVFGKTNPIRFFKGIAPAQLIAFSSCSSAAALPINMECVEKNLNVPKHISSFVLTLGSTINMDGSAIYQGAAAIFIAQVYGLDLNMAQLLTIVLVGTLSSIGAAGVPGAGLIMLTMVLTSVGLPLEGVTLIAGVDRILDMIRTALNITGDASAAVIVSKSESNYFDKAF